MRTNTHVSMRDRKLINHGLYCIKDTTDKTLEIAIRLSPKQLDHAVPVLEELIQEMLDERQKGLHRSLAECCSLTVRKMALL